MTYSEPSSIPDCALVDIRYRGGYIALAIDPTKRRWTINDRSFSNPNPFDIQDWRPTGETEWRPNPLLKTERNAA